VPFFLPKDLINRQLVNFYTIAILMEHNLQLLSLDVCAYTKNGYIQAIIAYNAIKYSV